MITYLGIVIICSIVYTVEMLETTSFNTIYNGNVTELWISTDNYSKHLYFYKTKTFLHS